MTEKKILTDNEKSETRKAAEAESSEIRRISGTKNSEGILMAAKKPKAAVASNGSKPVKAPRSYSKISETKHGAVVIISFNDCLKLGFNKDSSTKEVIDHVNKKLGLQ